MTESSVDRFRRIQARKEFPTGYWRSYAADHELVFIHVPKCAGRTVRGCGLPLTAFGHTTATYVRDVMLGRSRYEDAVSFAIMRDVYHRAPSCYLQGAPNIDRLFTNFRDVERDYFRRTGIFPIMHIIGIRKSLCDAHPWLPVNVYNAFVEAKRMCMSELGQIGHLYTSLPWGVAEFQDVQTLMGEDYWRYGVEENRLELEALCRYSFEQGLSARKLAPEDLFAAPVRELFKI